MIDFENYYDEIILFSVFLSFVVSYLSLETIYAMAKSRNLTDTPTERSSHTKITPTLGGVAIYLSLLVITLCFGFIFDTELMLMFLASISVLLFLGLKDDLLGLSSRKKFVIQLLIGLVFILITDIRITSLFGIFGLDMLVYEHSVVFSVFVCILIINSFNMIDGIDGLAAGFGILITTALSFLNFLENQFGLAMLSLTVTGALIAFLRLNLSERRKMFMGDTGSMIIGFCISVLAINFLKVTQSSVLSSFHETAPIIILSLLFFPLLDTFRVFMLRVFKYKRSPFKADNNHIHHYYLKILKGHKRVSFLIIFINILIILSTFFIGPRIWWISILSLVTIGACLYFFSYQLIKKVVKK